MKNQAAVELGRLGGKTTSEAKTAAVRENGRLGGRPSGVKAAEDQIPPPQPMPGETAEILDAICVEFGQSTDRMAAELVRLGATTEFCAIIQRQWSWTWIARAVANARDARDERIFDPAILERLHPTPVIEKAQARPPRAPVSPMRRDGKIKLPPAPLSK